MIHKELYLLELKENKDLNILLQDYCEATSNLIFRFFIGTKA